MRVFMDRPAIIGNIPSLRPIFPGIIIARSYIAGIIIFR